jgi:hypothetical protein
VPFCGKVGFCDYPDEIPLGAYDGKAAHPFVEHEQGGFFEVPVFVKDRNRL